MITKCLALTAALMTVALAGTAKAQYYYPTTTYYAAPAPVVNSYPGPVYYSQPVYSQPTYAQPVYAAPVYAAPVYATPYYGYGGYGRGGYYSPLSIGLNFGFGGGHRGWR